MIIIIVSESNCDIAAAMKMKELKTEERPREKIIAAGTEGLSNGELVAVLLRNGNRNESALDLGRRLLEEGGGSLTGLFSMSAEKMCGIGGIGPCKSAEICAALELGRRFLEERVLADKRPIVTARMVYDLEIPRYKGLDREICSVLFLNRGNVLTGRSVVSSGSSTSTGVEIKDIVRRAIEARASGIIMVHNHPSGNPVPSEADLRQTQKLKKALSPFDVTLVDHVIICDDRYYSFDEERTVKIPL